MTDGPSAGPGPAAGRLVVIVGAKGGVGTTAIAAALGAALARREEALLVTLPGPGEDLSLWFAAASAPGGSLADLEGSLASLTPELLEASTRPAGPRLRLLTPGGGNWSAADTRVLLALARARYPWVVVDAGAWRGGDPDGSLAGAVAEAALALIVFTPDPLAIRRARALGEALRVAGRPIRALLNRAAAGGSRGREAAGLDGIPVLGTVAEAAEFAEAMLRGEPVGWGGTKSPAAGEVGRVADALAEYAPAATEESRPDAAGGDGEAYRTPAFRALKRTLHAKFLDRMRERPGIGADPARVRAELADLLQGEGVPDLTAGFRERLLKELADGVLGLGPLQVLLDDPEVTEVMVNGPDEIYVERKGKLSRVRQSLDGEVELRGLIERIVAPLGRRIDESSPLVDARLADGSRVNAIIPPLALKGSSLTIRKFAKRRMTIEDLVRSGSLTEPAARFLQACVAGRLNCLISGGTGSGKTTLLNILASFIGPEERIVTIEDAAELKLPQEHVVSLESRPPNLEGRGAVTIRDLVRNALRMRPDRIVVGECRGGESLDMLQAMNTGHDGSLSTLHANTPRDALARLETMVLMSGMDLPLRAIREQASSAIDLIVQIARQRDGGRRVVQITEVCGMEGDVFRLQDIFMRRGEGALESAGLMPRVAEKLAERGQPLPAGVF